MGEGPTRKVKEIKDKYVYIPLLQVLEQLLMCPAVYEEVQQPPFILLLHTFLCGVKVMRGHQRSDNILVDYCDLPKFKSHPLFCRRPHALQLILYFDELELSNPLGAFHRKHKLGKSIMYVSYVYMCIMLCIYVCIPDT